MIEINLLPSELKVTIKKSVIKVENLFPLIVMICGLLVCVNIYFIVVNSFKYIQLRTLTAKWDSFIPQRKLVEAFNQENEAGSSYTQAIQKLEQGSVKTAQKINRLSLDLPSGVWFGDLLLNQKELILRGSAVSLDKQELSLINKLIDNLKNDKVFYGDFESLELGTVSRRKVGSYDVVDFVLNGKLKAK